MKWILLCIRIWNKSFFSHISCIRETHIYVIRPTFHVYKSFQTNETYKRDLQKRPTKQTYKIDLQQSQNPSHTPWVGSSHARPRLRLSFRWGAAHIYILSIRKESCKGDLRKQKVKRDLSKHPHTPSQGPWNARPRLCLSVRWSVAHRHWYIWKKTYKRNLQRRPCKTNLQMRPTKEPYKKEIQKRPTKETCKRDLQKRPTKETCQRNQQKNSAHLGKAARVRGRVGSALFDETLLKIYASVYMKRDLQKRSTHTLCIP